MAALISSTVAAASMAVCMSAYLVLIAALAVSAPSICPGICLAMASSYGWNSTDRASLRLS